jgi:branched-chain amino acid transport system permease protein
MQQVINGSITGAIYCLFAVGISLTWGSLNVLNLAHGAVFMFSGFLCYVLNVRQNLDLPLLPLIVVAVAIGALLEVLTDIFVFRPIRARAGAAQSELSSLIASIGLAAVLVAIATRVTAGNNFTISRQPLNTVTYHFGKEYVTQADIEIFVTAICISLVLAIWIGHSQSGRALRALAHDSETCELLGVNRRYLSSLASIISGATAGLAGIYLAIFLDNLNAQSGQDVLLEAFAVVVLGGVGSIWGCMVGAFLVAGGETLVSATTSGTWTGGVAFGIIIVVLPILPNGLFNPRRVVDRV